MLGAWKDCSMSLDLSLVPMKELMVEAEKRCCTFICAYELHQDKKKFVENIYGKGNWFESVRLSAVLNNDVLNNWNGELRTLQRINNDERDDV